MNEQTDECIRNESTLDQKDLVFSFRNSSLAQNKIPRTYPGGSPSQQQKEKKYFSHPTYESISKTVITFHRTVL